MGVRTIDASVLGAVGLLLTPLSAMAGAVFVLLTRRIKTLERDYKEITAWAIVNCGEKAEGLEKLADIIVSGAKEIE